LSVRVLEVLATLRRAGAERVAVAVACGLDPARFETGVVSLYDAYAGGFEPQLAERGLPVWHLGKRHGFDPRMWIRLARVFREFRPQIIHTHSYVMRYVLPVRTGRVVHTVHNVADREVDAVGKLIHHAAFRTGALAVAISSEVARSFRVLYRLEPAALIPNGVETCAGYREGARDRWRQAHGFTEGDLLIVSVARLEQQKNPLGLIDAFAAGLREHPCAHLLMAGEGSLLDPARMLATRLGVAGRVHFLGLCQDVPELLSACDLFALASDWEGTPVAVIEAMAARLPVVATAAGGVPELVEDGVTGALVPPGDLTALGHALRALAQDAGRRRAWGQAGARRAVRFEAGAMVASYAELFEKSVRGRS